MYYRTFKTFVYLHVFQYVSSNILYEFFLSYNFLKFVGAQFVLLNSSYFLIQLVLFFFFNNTLFFNFLCFAFHALIDYFILYFLIRALLACLHFFTMIC